MSRYASSQMGLESFQFSVSLPLAWQCNFHLLRQHELRSLHSRQRVEGSDKEVFDTAASAQ